MTGIQSSNERLATLENQVDNLQTSVTELKTSVDLLHGKFDAFLKIIMENYVAKETFDEYKRSKWLERLLIIIITAIISGLIAYFLRQYKV